MYITSHKQVLLVGASATSVLFPKMYSKVQLVVIALSLCAAFVVANDTPTVGGLQRIDINNSILLDALAAVQPQMQDHIDKINSLYAHRLKVTDAFSQVVAGLKFHVTLQLTETSCLKSNTTTNLESCSATKTKTCKAEIWVQTWLNHNELQKFECTEWSAAMSGWTNIWYTGASLILQMNLLCNKLYLINCHKHARIVSCDSYVTCTTDITLSESRVCR